ncbi:tryptophan-rich sensory protein [Paracoccus sp. Z330]|uniref:Tryptophan-rich sensory protein n=1 Tax=Paracoccus onchidii TaxID=3017813 RepID=A0ABT4ZEU1_9RHOB|nr:tryptophan-rich sensory protein [Paracoccus onchidii]MDB6177195.1 tryptophan-rich sensory protein [Paracoccus onchidii]
MTRFLSLLVLIAALAFVASPFLFGQFQGYPPELFPVPQDEPPVQPVGWAFSIWGVIYAWLVAGSGFGLIARHSDDDWSAMRWPLLSSLIMGFFWIPLAGNAPVPATVLILAMAIAAIVAMLRAGSGDRWWQLLPIGIYAGWLTAASGVSLGIVLGGYGIMSPFWAAVLSLIAVCAVTLVVQKARPDCQSYSLAVVWALLGVVAANLSPASPAIVVVAALGGLAVVAQLVRMRFARFGDAH